MSSAAGPGGPVIAVGRIIGPHGVAGLLKIAPLTDFPERCAELTEVICEWNSRRQQFTVERATLHGDIWLVQLAGIDSREAAAVLRGGLLLIRPEERVALPEGRYYFDQLIGLMVYNTAGEQLGRLRKVIPGAAHDHYLVQSTAPDKKEFLLPAVREFIREIDLLQGKIVAEPPAGLLEL